MAVNPDEPKKNNPLDQLTALVENLDEGVKKIAILIAAGLGLILFALLVFSLFPAQEPQAPGAGGEAQVRMQAPEISDFGLPDIPGRILDGDWSPAYPPKPRWTAEDLARFLPPLRELFLVNLRERNQRDFEALLDTLE